MRNLKVSLKAAAVAFAVCTCLYSIANAEDGVTDNEILVGVVNQQTGPIASSGIAIVNGLKAAFERENRKGGIHGRKIQMKVYDDAYDPKKSLELTDKAIKQDKVFLLTGYNGTVTVKAVYPILSKGEVPFLFPRTGDRVLTEHSPVVLTSRAEFSDELLNIVTHMKHRNLKRAAILYQADSLGNSIKAAAVEAMKKTGFFDPTKTPMPFVAEAVVDRKAGPEEYKKAFAALAQGNPDSVIVASSSTTAGNVVKVMLENKKNWAWMTTSQSNAIIEIIGDTNADVTVSQVVPPFDGKDSLATEYREDMKAIGLTDKIGYLAYESYINGRLILEAMKRAGKDLNRKSLIKAFESKPMNFGPYSAQWTEANHRSEGKSYLSKMHGNKLIAIK